jgi:Na+/H+-dicarboxylate symporter
MRFFWLLLVALGLGTKRHWHIFFAIVLGIVLGLLFAGPQYTMLLNFFEVVAQIFMRLITMLVVPLVVSSLIVGVSSLGDGRQLGRMGGKVLFYFLVFMAIASVLGAGLATLLEPGEHLKAVIANYAQLYSSTTDHAEVIRQASTPDFKSFILEIIPKNPMEALAKMELIPLIFFTIVFGVAIACIGDAGRPLISFFEALFAATMKLTDWVMVLAVPGIFSLSFVTVAKAGPDIFINLWPYIAVILVGLLIQIFIVFPIMLKVLARINFMNLYRAISEAIMVAFGTASSSATLPVTIACCERRAGISNRIASFVLPTGATLNKTATTMFEVIAVMTLAQAFNLPIGLEGTLLIMVFAIIASIGAPGVPSTGLITMAIVINSMGEAYLPALAGIGVLWSIDRALDMCRTVVNVVSSCTVATLVASSEGELNRDILNNKEVWMEVV